MSEWITHRLPTAADADANGNVLIPCERENVVEWLGCVIPGEAYTHAMFTGIVLGQRWWPANKLAAMTAQAQQTAAAAERAAAAAANPDLTPEPAVEPSPAVAGVPSDQELWEVQLKVKSQSRPHIGWQVWSPESEPLIAAHRALYDYGYRRCLEEAKATRELNKGLHVALQEENARLKSKVEEFVGKMQVLDRGLNNAARDLEYKERHLNGAYCRIKELERELERRDGEPTPAPEPAVRKVVDCKVIERRQNEVSTTYALCDDGSLWYIHAFPDSEWISLPTIPQTPIQ